MSRLPNIILTGFSATGKSRVGAEVARILQWQLIDTDAEIMRWSGKSIGNIFADEGEEAFRDLEREVLKDALAVDQTVIATGGGVLMDPRNREAIFDRGIVVGLEATIETIHRRLTTQGNDYREIQDRPLIASPDPLKRIQQLKNARQPFYAMGHWTVHTDRLTEPQVAAEVIRAWQTLKDKIPTVKNADQELASVVTHANGSCPIRVGWGILDHLGELVSQIGIEGPVYIISDENVFPNYGRQSQRSLQSAGIEAHCFIIPSGEGSKTLGMAQAIYDWLAHRRAERRHLILAVGGGVVGDLAGFVAASFLRGVPFIQVPTSMAAMVDASIGGKVAVNLPQAKNLVGAFYQPLMVVADPQVLTTLGKRELAEGWAEAIKHGFIIDADLVSIFEERTDQLMALEPDISTEVIRRSIAIKAAVVSGDERETGGRRTLLNYGHTVGHALEACTAYGTFLHGEAVSVGMTGAAYISQKLGMIDRHLVERQTKLLKRFNLPVGVSGVDRGRLFEAMALDKKTEKGAIRWVLLESFGKAVTRTDVPNQLVEEAVGDLIW